MRTSTSAQVCLVAAILGAAVPAWASEVDAPRSARLLADSDSALVLAPYATGRMVAVTLLSPIGGLIGGVVGALAGALVDSVTTRVGFVTAGGGLAGYVIGTGWAAAALGWAMQGGGTFGAAMLGATLGAGAAVSAVFAFASLIASSRTFSPLMSMAAPALTLLAAVLPALGASIAFEASHDLERHRSRARAEVSPIVLLDGRRPAFGLALDAAF